MVKGSFIPPPEQFDGKNYHSIDDFFYFYERFCQAIYGKDNVSWLQVLPDFLYGEYKSIVEAFGRSKDVSYETVKCRLIKEIRFQSIGDTCFCNFWELLGRRENPCCVTALD